MVACPGSRGFPIPVFGQVRLRIIFCVLAALLALVNVNVMQHTVPNGARGNYTALVAVDGTRIRLSCEGNGPVTVAIIGPSGLSTAIDNAVQDELARSVRLCRVDVAEPPSRSNPDLVRMLPATLHGQRVPSPFVIVSAASHLPAFSAGTERTPFIEDVAGWVFIHPMPPPATGMVIRADGNTWPLPIGEPRETTLAMLKLFWPPDE